MVEAALALGTIGKAMSGYYSQHGEDRLIERIIENNPVKWSKIACEIGAWDGVHLSNICHLVRVCGWSGTFIESNMDKFAHLTREHPNQMKICVKVTKDNVNDLHLPLNIDVLSIDVDGDDYYIWESLILKPKIVCIEYNPTIPPWLNIRGKEGTRIGSSKSALEALGHSKGYKLNIVTDTNLIFLDTDCPNHFNLNYLPTKHLESVISDYDGNRLTLGSTCYGNNGELDSTLLIQ